MRALVFFDLPTETSADRRQYRLFRKFLIKEGFIMVQQSVYSKLVLNDQSYRAEVDRLFKAKPPKGLVQVLRVTEKQYEDMIFITGGWAQKEEVDSLETLVVI